MEFPMGDNVMHLMPRDDIDEDLNKSPTMNETRIFRKQLDDAKQSGNRAKMQELFEEACQGNACEIFVEECVIAGYDVSLLNDVCKTKVENLLIDGKLPYIQNQDDPDWLTRRLKYFLETGDEKHFVMALEYLHKNKSENLRQILDNDSENLFYEAAKINCLTSIEKLVEFGAKHVSKGFIGACKTGSWQALRLLLERFDTGENISIYKDMFHQLFEYKNPNRTSECVDLCLEQLLRQIEKYDIDINQLYRDNCVSMHNLRDNPNKIAQFLKNGAYLGMRSMNCHEIDISIIEPKLLERHFDSCIESYTQTPNNENNFSMVKRFDFDYKNLFYPHFEGKVFRSNEMTAIEFMLNSNEHRHLVRHPLIWSFIYLKWHRFSLLFYIDFILCSLFTSSIIGYILVIHEDFPGYVASTLFSLTIILAMYVGFRRLLDMMVCTGSYRRSWRNYLRCLHTILIIIFVAIVLCNMYPEHYTTFAAICILLITSDLFVLAGSLFWSFSMYYIMFLDVAWSSIKSLQLCIVLLPAFALSFFLLLRDMSNTNTNQDNKALLKLCNLSDSSEAFSQLQEQLLLLRDLMNSQDDDVSFMTFGATLIKTIVMSTGEFDMNFDLNVVALVIFFGFMFLITIVFMNLMNGLAVSDTQKIKDDAELTSLIQRCQVLGRYENVLTRKNFWFWQTFNGTWIMTLFDYFTKPDAFRFMQRPNSTRIEVEPNTRIITIFTSWNTKGEIRLPMDPQVIDCATQLMDKRGMCQSNERETNLLMEHLARLEMLIESKFKDLDTRLSSIESHFELK